jgi:hypothetical protein
VKPEFLVDALVEVRREDSSEYVLARIAGVLGDGLFDVELENGDFEGQVDADRIRLRAQSDAPLVGMVVGDERRTRSSNQDEEEEEEEEEMEVGDTSDNEDDADF